MAGLALADAEGEHAFGGEAEDGFEWPGQLQVGAAGELRDRAAKMLENPGLVGCQKYEARQQIEHDELKEDERQQRRFEEPEQPGIRNFETELVIERAGNVAGPGTGFGEQAADPAFEGPANGRAAGAGPVQFRQGIDCEFAGEDAGECRENDRGKQVGGRIADLAGQRCHAG